MKPKPFEIIVEFIPQCTKTGITYETYQKGLLIRCKDCKYYSDDAGVCIGFGDGHYVTEEDFCSNAERRKDDRRQNNTV